MHVTLSYINAKHYKLRKRLIIDFKRFGINLHKIMKMKKIYMYKLVNWAVRFILGGLDLFFNPPNLLIGRFDFTSGCSVCIFRRFIRVGFGGLFILVGLEIFFEHP